MKAEETLVVIPWLPSASQGRELAYAVEGWRRHFKQPHRIIVVGEGVTGKVPEGVEAIESHRVSPVEGQYRQHLDYVSCLKKVRQRYPETDGFIMVADDCYAVNDFDMADVLFLKQIADTFCGTKDGPNPWQRDKWKTAEVLKAGGYPTHNCTTHLPQWFDWDKLIDLWNKYNMARVSYTVEDLYYNIYFKGRVFFQLDDTDNLKFGLYQDDIDADRIRRVMKRKIWLTNSPIGWTKALDGVLHEYYGI